MHNFPDPKWLKKLPKEERSTARQRFFLVLASLYASEPGSLRQLSIQLDKNPNTISAMTSNRENPITPEIAIAIEKLLGVDLFPRTLLRPDHFAIGG